MTRYVAFYEAAPRVNVGTFIGAELASFKPPEGLTLVDELPLTPMFKFDKQVLESRGRG